MPLSIICCRLNPQYSDNHSATWELKWWSSKPSKPSQAVSQVGTRGSLSLGSGEGWVRGDNSGLLKDEEESARLGINLSFLN